MKTSADDDTLQMVEWPFLLPDDFEPRFEFIIYVYVVFCFWALKNHQMSPNK